MLASFPGRRSSGLPTSVSSNYIRMYLMAVAIFHSGCEYRISAYDTYDFSSCYCQLSGSGSNSLISCKLPGHFSYGLGIGLDWSMKGMPLPHVHCSVQVGVYLKCMCFTHAHAHGLITTTCNHHSYVRVCKYFQTHVHGVYAQCRNGCYRSDHMFNLHPGNVGGHQQPRGRG